MISIAALRVMSDNEDLVALVEAVEAAMAVQASHAETRIFTPEERRLLLALARFDFSEAK